MKVVFEAKSWDSDLGTTSLSPQPPSSRWNVLERVRSNEVTRAASALERETRRGGCACAGGVWEEGGRAAQWEYQHVFGEECKYVKLSLRIYGMIQKYFCLKTADIRFSKYSILKTAVKVWVCCQQWKAQIITNRLCQRQFEWIVFGYTGFSLYSSCNNEFKLWRQKNRRHFIWQMGYSLNCSWWCMRESFGKPPATGLPHYILDWNI